MSPTKKKTAKKKAAASGTKRKTGAKVSSKPSSAKAKASRKKPAAAKKAAARKTAAAKKTAAPKAARKKAAARKPKDVAAKAKKAADLSAPIGTEQNAAPLGKAPQQRAATRPAVPKKRAPRGKPTPLSTVPHPKFGLKFECFKCQAKFYDLGKPDPICPKCGADQRDRPRAVPKPQPAPTPRRLGDRPIVPLLDDEDEVTSEVVSFEDAGEVTATPPAVDIFDDADDASVDDDEIFEIGERRPMRRAIADDSEES